MAFKLNGLSLLLILLVIGAVLFICLGCKITCDSKSREGLLHEMGDCQRPSDCPGLSPQICAAYFMSNGALNTRGGKCVDMAIR